MTTHVVSIHTALPHLRAGKTIRHVTTKQCWLVNNGKLFCGDAVMTQARHIPWAMLNNDAKVWEVLDE